MKILGIMSGPGIDGVGFALAEFMLRPAAFHCRLHLPRAGRVVLRGTG